MKRNLILIALVVCFLSNGNAVIAQDGFSLGLSSLRNAASVMLDWFGSLSQQINAIADSEERRRIKVELIDLSKSMYRLEQNSRYLLEALERPSVNMTQVSQYRRETESSLRDVRSKLGLVGLSLREQYRAGGLEAEREISTALGSRAGFLHELDDTLRAGRPVPDALIQEGRSALEAISAANEELLKVIGSLRI